VVVVLYAAAVLLRSALRGAPVIETAGVLP
jgi:hypothetical protein